MRTTCGVFIVSSDKKILACHPTRHYPTQWDIPKGIMDEGEDPVETAIREVREETGLDLTQLNGTLYDYGIKYGTYTYKHKKKQLYPFIFKLNISSEAIDITSLKCESMVIEFKGLSPFPEVDAYSWIKFIDRMILHDTQQRFLLDVEASEFLFNEIITLDMLTDQSVNFIKSNRYG